MSDTKELILRVTNSKRTFWLFNSIAWLLFGLILFLSGFGHQSFLSTLVRNSLFAILGFGLSILLRNAYGFLWKKYSSFIINFFAAFFLSFICGVISGLVLNPITFYVFHGGLGDQPFFALFAGVLNFGFVYMIWSACYYGLKQYIKADLKTPNNNYLQRIPVNLSKQILLIKTNEVTHIAADGDYVKIHALDKSYLLRKSLGSLQDQLDPSVFHRIHRSTIVNSDFVSSLKPHINGEFFVVLSNGINLKLSRSYKHILKSFDL